MSSLARIKLVQGLNSFAMLLGMKPAALAYILYKLPPAQKYESFDIAKKSGGVRKIMAPEPRLKLVQRRLATLLLSCQSEIEISIGVKDECTLAHGFKPRFSILTNAEKHRNRRWVYNADIEDFFPTINFGRVYGFFQKNKHFSLSKPVATIIAQIACHENQLPQGSPNIIAHILDIHLNDLAFKHNCTYTRYADDLTFSTNEKSFPRAIAKRHEGDIHKWLPGEAQRHSMCKFTPRRVCELDLPMRRKEFPWPIPPDSVALLDRQKFAARRHARARRLGTACGRHERNVELNSRPLRHVRTRRAPLRLDQARHRARLAQRDPARRHGRQPERPRSVSSAGRSNATRRSLRGGTSRSKHSRSAVTSPASARSIAFRVSAAASPPRNASAATVARLRAPFGRPDGLPLVPGVNGRPRRCFRSVISLSNVRPYSPLAASNIWVVIWV